MRKKYTQLFIEWISDMTEITRQCHVKMREIRLAIRCKKCSNVLIANTDIKSQSIITEDNTSCEKCKELKR
jgi:Zn finger protein HypA/HybF involved in hydrogenase expression